MIPKDMQQISASNLRKLQNVYDTDLAIIPEMVDSALAHFFTKQIYKPMNLEVRIVPEIQNRRNVTLIIGDTESIKIEENKYLTPCACKRQIEKEIQKLRLHLACNEIRKRWHQIYSGEKPSYQNDESTYLYTPSIISSTSTAKPIPTTIRGSTSLSHKSYLNVLRSNCPVIHRSQSF